LDSSKNNFEVFNFEKLVEKIVKNSQKILKKYGINTSLFIDFSPSKKGVKGQIVRFLHDPDEIRRHGGLFRFDKAVSADADLRLSQAGGGESMARGPEPYRPLASGRAQLGTNRSQNDHITR